MLLVFFLKTLYFHLLPNHSQTNIPVGIVLCNQCNSSWQVNTVYLGNWVMNFELKLTHDIPVSARKLDFVKVMNKQCRDRISLFFFIT
jgi:hypothetical protein